jgi:hypothetical protein
MITPLELDPPIGTPLEPLPLEPLFHGLMITPLELAPPLEAPLEPFPLEPLLEP